MSHYLRHVVSDVGQEARHVATEAGSDTKGQVSSSSFLKTMYYILHRYSHIFNFPKKKYLKYLALGSGPFAISSVLAATINVVAVFTPSLTGWSYSAPASGLHHSVDINQHDLSSIFSFGNVGKDYCKDSWTTCNDRVFKLVYNGKYLTWYENFNKDTAVEHIMEWYTTQCTFSVTYYYGAKADMSLEVQQFAEIDLGTISCNNIVQYYNTYRSYPNRCKGSFSDYSVALVNNLHRLNDEHEFYFPYSSTTQAKPLYFERINTISHIYNYISDCDVQSEFDINVQSKFDIEYLK